MASKAVNRHKSIRKSNDKRFRVLSMLEGETVTATGTFTCVKNVLSETYIGKSLLFRDVVINDVLLDHIWVHLDNILNWDDSTPPRTRLKFTGKPYSYLHTYINKPKDIKYSLKSIIIQKEK